MTYGDHDNPADELRVMQRENDILGNALAEMTNERDELKKSLAFADELLSGLKAERDKLLASAKVRNGNLERLRDGYDELAELLDEACMYLCSSGGAAGELYDRIQAALDGGKSDG